MKIKDVEEWVSMEAERCDKIEKKRKELKIYNMDYYIELTKILNFYGLETQYKQLQTEVGELMVAVGNVMIPDDLKPSSKRLSDEEHRENVKTEIADVFIMLGQFMVALDIDESDLIDEVQWKLKRQKNRIEKTREELQK